MYGQIQKSKETCSKKAPIRLPFHFRCMSTDQGGRLGMYKGRYAMSRKPADTQGYTTAGRLSATV